MSFYQSIAPYYHLIFPTGKAQIDFIKNTSLEGESASFLDVGCAIGGLSTELSAYFEKVVGIDLDVEMVARAKSENQQPNISFYQLGMLQIVEQFGGKSFDIVSCLGNTLVHLPSLQDIGDFLAQTRKVLKDKGKLLVQIVNYDRILDQQITSLPTLEKEEITFERRYKYSPETNKIRFGTKLTVKGTGEEIANTVELYPLRKTEMKNLFRDTGYSHIQFYGNFQRESFYENAIPLIVEAW